jgi:hypothetical protein
MIKNRVGLSLLFVAFLGAPTGFGAEFSTRIVDGLGRPIQGVAVQVKYSQKDAGGAYRSVAFLELISDAEGRVHGEYDEQVLPSGEWTSVDLRREGYSNYVITGPFQPEYTLERIYPETALDEVGRLAEADRPAAIRELLAGAGSLEEGIFIRDHLFRPALQRLIEDPKVGFEAIVILASIGVPEDVRWIIQHAPAPRREGWRDGWAYGVVTSLLAPVSVAEWTFLAKCALGEYEDGSVEGGALQSLKLIATVQSQMLLEAVRCKFPSRAGGVDEAIAYGKLNPRPLADRDLTALAQRVAQAIAGNSRGQIDHPRFNEQGDKARIELEFIEGNCGFTYTAAFQRVDTIWQLRGIRFTQHSSYATVRPETEEKANRD